MTSAKIKKVKNIVIGSGPAGRLGAYELGSLGEETVLVEKKHIAGTCLNEGCMVICALTDASRFLKNAKRFQNLGIINGEISFSYENTVAKIKETQKILRKINESENESVNNTIIYGEASVEINEENKIIVKIRKNEDNNTNISIYETEKLLITTGARPFIPNIKGAKYALTSKDVLKLKEIPKKINIIGGGIIATELSNIFSSFGCKVNMIVRSSALKELESEIKDYVINKLIQDISIYENTDVLEIKEDSIITNKGEFKGKTLIATGRIPNSEIISDIVETNVDGSIKVNEFMQTSNPNIYSAGDVTGGLNLTPVARREGIAAARNIAGYLNKLEDKIIPQSLTLDMDVSFTHNPHNFKNKTKENSEIKDIIIPGLAGPHAFWKILNIETGITKVSINEKTEEIINASSISPSSIDDTAYLAFLMNLGIKKEDFEEFIEVHPSTDAYYKILKLMHV